MGHAEQARALEDRFWKELEDSPFVMLSFTGTSGDEARPMTAQIDGRRIWFFGSKEDDLVGAVNGSRPVIANFAAKGHDFFAAIHGTLVADNDPATIDRLWSPSVAAWYKEGRDDPKLALARFDTDKADLWDASSGSLFDAIYHRIKGDNPTEERSDRRAEVAL